MEAPAIGPREVCPGFRFGEQRREFGTVFDAVLSDVVDRQRWEVTSGFKEEAASLSLLFARAAIAQRT